MYRAYARLQIKAIREDARIITGLATTPTPDRTGDVVEPTGALFELPLPLLWQHDAKQPIGSVTKATVTPDGIEITAALAKIDEPGPLKDRIDMAWQSIKAELVRGLSIGFRDLESAYLKDTGAFHFLKWLWLELSAVTIPANAEATIATIKSLDVGGSAPRSVGLIHAPGASGLSRRTTTRRSERPMKKTFADQIKEWEATRQAKAARMDDLLAKSGDAGVTLDAAEQEEHDALADEVKHIDAQLVRLRAAEARALAGAVEVKGATPREVESARTATLPRISVTRTLPKGILFARYAMCVGASRGVPAEAIRLAKEHYPDDPGVVQLVEKASAPVHGGATTGSHWLDDMVPYNVMQDFIEYLRPGSIVGKFGGPNPGGGRDYPSLNRKGFNERVSGMSAGFTAGWVGEGLPALPSAAVTFNQMLLYHKLAALAVLTKEAIRFSNPSAEATVRDDLARAVNGVMDHDFVDPAKAANGMTSPASITNGVVVTPPTGSTAANLMTDLATMIGKFGANNLDPGDIVLIMSTQMALEISFMLNALGVSQFPEINMAGGTLRGFPVITSEHLTTIGQAIVAVKASDVYLADDGVVTVEASDQASLEMVDSGSLQNVITGTPPATALISLWQTGAVGLKAVREITWKLRRATAVQYLMPAAYHA
jgi:HK97 family phage prohead protease/HK97 family phage major capsid protein